MTAYWGGRCFFNCPPDCPERKPGCQDHCRTYLDKKEEWDALKAAERKRKEAATLTIENIVRKKDVQARIRRNIPSHKRKS